MAWEVNDHVKTYFSATLIAYLGSGYAYWDIITSTAWKF